jgi:predicted nucleotidyltransferase
MEKQELLSEIKRLVLLQEPDAEIILYGSYARGDNRPDSDLDLLILLQKEKVTYFDEKRISYPLYALEINTGQIISPLILPKNKWEKKFRITSLYQNIQKEGRSL